MGILQFDSRKNYFDGCGTEITGAQKTETAIKLAGLDFEVQKQPLFLGNGKQAEGCYANVRMDTEQILGQCKERYEVLQNSEAFDFLDSFIENGANYVNAGTVKGGKQSFIVAETEPMKILGDEFKPYILFTNSFDGSTGVQAMFTPVRVFCSNCFVAASKQAENKITIKHSKNMKDKLMIARDIMLKNTKYLDYIKERSEELAVTELTKEQFESVVEKIVPIKPEATGAILERQEAFRQDIMRAYDEDDLQNYNNTVYKALMAIADAESHKKTLRVTDNAQFQAMGRIMGGMVLLNAAAQEIQRRLGMRVF